jgi:alpha-1,2-mannosyltransferase
VLGYSWWKGFTLVQRIAILGFFTICFEPLCLGVGHGQVSALVLFFLSLFLLHSLTGYEVVAGIALACAIQLKMTPAIIILAPLIFGRWKTIVWCGVASAALILFTVVDIGSFGVFKDFLFSVSSTEENVVIRSNPFNFRVDKSVLSIVGLFDNQYARLAFKLLLLVTLLVTSIAIRLRGKANYPTAISFLMVGMVFASPIIWDHHLTWLLPSLAVMTMTTARNGQERLKVLTLSLGAMLCLTKVYLIHFTVYHSAPYLLEISALIPCGILMAMGIFLMRSRVEVEEVGDTIDEASLRLMDMPDVE